MGAETPEAAELKDKSGDRRYFVIVPQLVWALSRSSYDLSLWLAVKMVAGEDGECYLSRDQLAMLAMMSAGKVSDCRDHLLSVGLLQGELRRDPGYPQPVWHLRVPDLWARNVKWREEIGDSLADRVAYKGGEWPSLRDEAEEASPGDGYPSPGDEGMSPHDGGMSPGDGKKNQTKIQEGEPAPTTTDAPQAAPTVGVGGNASLSEADADTEAEAAFTEMCGELSERLGLVISATLRAKLRQAYDADGGRRLRGLYEHVTTAPNLTNPAGMMVRWIDDGPTLESLPSAVHNRCKPQPWYGYTDQATGEWVAAGPKPTRWGRYPDAAPEAATVQAGDGERLYSMVGPDGETRDYTSAELEGLRGKAADRQELETRDKWNIHG